MAKAIEGVCHGGQIIVSGETFSRIDGLLTRLGSPQVIDLGEHLVEGDCLVEATSKDEDFTTNLPSGCKKKIAHLFQLVPAPYAHDYAHCSGGERCCRRGRIFKPVQSLGRVSPGFDEAPAGPSITLCFLFTQGAKDLQTSAPSLAPDVLKLLRRSVRDVLNVGGGYECQEDEANFMLAFWNMRDVSAFAAALQRALPKLPWPDDLRMLSPTFAQGLRMSVGALSGGYTSRRPHATTGRADYFGTIVNRTARIAAAAHPGQVLLGGENPLGDVTMVQAVDGAPPVGFNLNATSAASSSTWELERLGAFALKGIDSPILLHELRLFREDGTLEVFPEPKTKGRLCS